MATTTASTLKTLEAQVAQLSAALDTLADGLPAAVRSAVSQAVRDAAQAAVAEALANPELLKHLHEANGAPSNPADTCAEVRANPASDVQPPSESVGSRLRSFAAKVKAKVIAGCGAVGKRLAALGSSARARFCALPIWSKTAIIVGSVLGGMVLLGPGILLKLSILGFIGWSVLTLARMRLAAAHTSPSPA
jgi:hypothetical protein